MKQIITLVMFLLIISVVAAQTFEELYTMDQKIGAELRLLQLEKAITRNIIAGNDVIGYLKGENVSKLEVLVTELEALKLEVQELEPQQAVEDYTLIKQEAVEITTEFRQIAGEMLEPGDRIEIARNMNSTELKEYKRQIVEKIHAQNAQITYKIFQALGVHNDELIDKIQKGEARLGQVRSEVRKALRDMTPEQRRAHWAVFKQAGLRRDVAVRARIERARININRRRARRLEYLEEASDNIEDPKRKARVKGILNARESVVNKRINRISNRLQKVRKARGGASK